MKRLSQKNKKTTMYPAMPRFVIRFSGAERPKSPIFATGSGDCSLLTRRILAGLRSLRR